MDSNQKIPSFLRSQNQERINRHLAVINNSASKDKSPISQMQAYLKDQFINPSGKKLKFKDQKEKLLKELSFGSPRRMLQRSGNSNLSDSKGGLQSPPITRVLFQLPQGTPRMSPQSARQLKQIIYHKQDSKNNWDIDNVINTYMSKVKGANSCTPDISSRLERSSVTKDKLSQVFGALERTSSSTVKNGEFQRKVSSIRRMMNHVFLKSNLRSGSQSGDGNNRLNQFLIPLKTPTNTQETKEDKGLYQLAQKFQENLASSMSLNKSIEEKYQERKQLLLNIFLETQQPQMQLKIVRSQKAKIKNIESPLPERYSTEGDEDYEVNAPISNCIELTEKRLKAEMENETKISSQNFLKTQQTKSDEYQMVFSTQLYQSNEIQENQYFTQAIAQFQSNQEQSVQRITENQCYLTQPTGLFKQQQEDQRENSSSIMSQDQIKKNDYLTQSSFEKWLQGKLDNNFSVETKRVSLELNEDIQQLEMKKNIDSQELQEQKWSFEQEMEQIQGPLSRFTKVRLTKVLNGTSCIVRRLNVMVKLTLVKAFFTVKECGNTQITQQKKQFALRTLNQLLRKHITVQYGFTFKQLNKYISITPIPKTEYSYEMTLSLEELAHMPPLKYTDGITPLLKYRHTVAFEPERSEMDIGKYAKTQQNEDDISKNNIVVQKQGVHQYIISNKRDDTHSTQPIKTEIFLYTSDRKSDKKSDRKSQPKKTPTKELRNMSVKTSTSEQRSRYISTYSHKGEQRNTYSQAFIPKKNVQQILQEISTPLQKAPEELINERIKANFEDFKNIKDDQYNTHCYLESPQENFIQQTGINDMSPIADPKELDLFDPSSTSYSQSKKNHYSKKLNIQNTFNNFLKNRQQQNIQSTTSQKCPPDINISDQVVPLKQTRSSKSTTGPVLSQQFRREKLLSDNIDFLNVQPQSLQTYYQEISTFSRTNKYEQSILQNQNSQKQISNHINMQKNKIASKFKQITRKSIGKHSTKSEFDEDFKQNLIQKENFQVETKKMNFEEYAKQHQKNRISQTGRETVKIPQQRSKF